MILKKNFRNIKYAIRSFWGRMYGCVGVLFNLVRNTEYMIEEWAVSMGDHSQCLLTLTDVPTFLKMIQYNYNNSTLESLNNYQNLFDFQMQNNNYRRLTLILISK